MVEYHGRGIGDPRGGVARAAARAGLGRIGKHALRHTAATWMILERETFEEVARFLGTTVAMIERVYGHHHPDFLRGAAKALEL